MDDQSKKVRKFNKEVIKGIGIFAIPMIACLMLFMIIFEPIMRDHLHMPDSVIFWIDMCFSFLLFLAAIIFFPYLKYKNTSDEFERKLLDGIFKLSAICASGFILWSFIDIILMSINIIIPKKENIIIGSISPVFIFVLLWMYHKKFREKRSRN